MSTASVLQLHQREYFPKWEHDEPTKRPFRIFGSKVYSREGKEVKKRGDLPGRRYASTLRAHDQALLLVRWEQVGTVFEVYDIRRGSLIGVYIREEKAVTFRVLKGGK